MRKAQSVKHFNVKGCMDKYNLLIPYTIARQPYASRFTP